MHLQKLHKTLIKPLKKANIPHSAFATISSINPNKDYYQTLGVPKAATEKEVKASFYKLAKQYHPDVYKGSQDKIKEVNEAYEVLGDKNKRKEYDSLRNTSQQQYNSPFSGGGPTGPQARYRQQQQQQQSQQYSQQQYQNPFGQGGKSGEGFNYQYYWERPNYQGNKNQSYYYQQDKHHNNGAQQGFNASYMDQAFKDFVNQAFQKRQQQQEQYQRYSQQEAFYNKAGANTGYQNTYKRSNVNSQQQQQYYQQYQQQQQQQQYNNQYSSGNRNPQNFSGSQEFDFNQWKEENDKAFRFYQEKLREKKREEERKKYEYELWKQKKEDDFVKEVTEKVEKIKEGVTKVSEGVTKAKDTLKNFWNSRKK